MDGKTIATKRFSDAEGALTEAGMLSKALDAGLDVAVPIEAHSYEAGKKLGLFGKKEYALFKKAGYPGGEIPYCLTDLAKVEEKLRASRLATHLEGSLEKTLEEFLGLLDKGLIHESLSPLTHDYLHNTKWKITKIGYIRGWDPSVNILPTGELKDFEHVKEYDKAERKEKCSSPFSEIMFMYTWTGLNCCMKPENIADVVYSGFSGRKKALKKRGFGVPKKGVLKAMAEDMEILINNIIDEGDGDFGDGPGMVSANLRRATKQVTRYSRIPTHGP